MDGPLPPLELISDFSDGVKWFEFEWVILKAELQMQFYLKKIEKTKGKSQIFKTFSDRGKANFEFDGRGVVKLTRTVRFLVIF
jgi:hypothetical protein